MKKLILVFSISLFCSGLVLAQEMGGVKGKIRNLQQGGVLAEVKVIAQQDGKDIKTTETNKNGEFVIDRLKAGKYTFVFSKRGFTTGTVANVEVGKNKIRDLGSKLALDLDEGMMVIIKGSVFNPDGRSIYGAIIDIARVHGDGSVKKLKSSYSSESGEFSFRFTEGVATYRITASAKGKSVSKEVSVDSAAIYRLALTLDLGKEKEDQ
jgi:hypothetical protein